MTPLSFPKDLVLLVGYIARKPKEGCEAGTNLIVNWITWRANVIRVDEIPYETEDIDWCEH